MNIILEEQIDTNTADRQLLYDIRTESRKTNELLSQLLEVLRPIAKDTVPKVVKPKSKAKPKPKSKEAKQNESLPKSVRRNSSKSPSSSSRHPNKRKTMPDK